MKKSILAILLALVVGVPASAGTITKSIDHGAGAYFEIVTDQIDSLGVDNTLLPVGFVAFEDSAATTANDSIGVAFEVHSGDIDSVRVDIYGAIGYANINRLNATDIVGERSLKLASYALGVGDKFTASEQWWDLGFPYNILSIDVTCISLTAGNSASQGRGRVSLYLPGGK